jgi:hypothetical protein
MKTHNSAACNDLSIILIVIAILIQFVAIGRAEQYPVNVNQMMASFQMILSESGNFQMASCAAALLGLISWTVSLFRRERALHTLPVILLVFFISSLIA